MAPPKGHNRCIKIPVSRYNLRSSKQKSSSDKFNERIQALPQELQDRILDYKLAIDPARITINDIYTRPWQLTVDRETRKRVAKQYYSTSTFVMNDPFLWEFAMWLRSLPKEHQALLANIEMHEQLVIDLPYDDNGEAMTLSEAMEGLQELTSVISSFDIPLQTTTIKFPIFVEVSCQICGQEHEQKILTSQEGPVAVNDGYFCPGGERA